MIDYGIYSIYLQFKQLNNVIGENILFMIRWRTSQKRALFKMGEYRFYYRSILFTTL